MEMFYEKIIDNNKELKRIKTKKENNIIKIKVKDKILKQKIWIYFEEEDTDINIVLNKGYVTSRLREEIRIRQLYYYFKEHITKRIEEHRKFRLLFLMEEGKVKTKNRIRDDYSIEDLVKTKKAFKEKFSENLSRNGYFLKETWVSLIPGYLIFSMRKEVDDALKELKDRGKKKEILQYRLLITLLWLCSICTPVMLCVYVSNLIFTTIDALKDTVLLKKYVRKDVLL